MELVDVVVVGAGFAGLSAAKAYLQCAQDTNLVLLDTYASVGGVWARQRIYPELRSNNLFGTFDLPDFPMTSEHGANQNEHISGDSLRRYLTAYAKHFDILSRIRFNSTVLSAEKIHDSDNSNHGWSLEVKSASDDSTEIRYNLICKKLIISTGFTSQPVTIDLPGQTEFQAPIVHFVDLAKYASTIQPGSHVSVCGGSKGAYDTVYLLAKSGMKVNWIIRKSGYGPTWMAPSHVDVGPFKQCWVEKLTTRRFLSWLAPCIWDINTGLSRWLRTLFHGTALGRKFIDLFWSTLSSETLDQSGLNKDPLLAPLKPDVSALWFGGSLSILNYPADTPFHSLVTSGKVEIHRTDISHLSSNVIHLSSGKAIPSEAGLITNGWKFNPNLVFKPETIHAELGIPSRHYSDAQRSFWHNLDDMAGEAILQQLPRLRTAPHRPGSDTEKVDDATTLEPFRLYRLLAPPILTARGDRSVVFQGFVSNGLNPTRNEVSALWCYAYLNGKLDSLDRKKENVDFQYQAALTSRFCALRFPYGYGHRFPDFIFELVPYLDNLLKDLGLPWKRKRSWLQEVFGAYGPEDYKGLTDEWMRKEAGALHDYADPKNI